MIEDPELRALFQAESEERLNHLESSLKELESDLSNQELIEGIFRDAHTIKGSARMLDLVPVEKIAHQMEELLERVRRTKACLTPIALASFYESLDAIRALILEAVEGTPSRVDVEAILRSMSIKHFEKKLELPPSSAPRSKEEIKMHVSPPKEGTSLPQERPIAVSSDKPSPEMVSDTVAAKILHRIAGHTLRSSTVRIQTQQLNELLTQAGNLTVAKNRIYGLIEQINQLIVYVEDISRMEGELALTPPAVKAFAGLSSRKYFRGDGWDNVMRHLVDKLNNLRSTATDDFHVLGSTITLVSDLIRKLGLVPLSHLLDLFPRMVTELARACGKEIDFSIEGGEITADKRIIEEMKDPIMHILRNAISHGIETPEERERLGKEKKGHVKLKAYQTSNKIGLEINDDGRGLDQEKIKQVALERKLFSEEELDRMSPSEIQSIIFLPGFSTVSVVTELSGRGVGMDVVQTHVEKLNGIIHIDSQLNVGCHIQIELPITLVTTHVLLVEVEHNIYAIPMDVVEVCEYISGNQLFTIEGRDVICREDEPISVALLADLLGIMAHQPIRERHEKLSCIVLMMKEKRVAVVVDAILEEQQVVVIPPNLLFGKIRTFAGATILQTGKVGIVLNPYDLIKDLDKGVLTPLATKRILQEKNGEKKNLLYVDDSYAMRVLIKKVLEAEGFNVIVAKDGMEAIQKLDAGIVIDALISDVDMPKMNGIELTKKVRLMRDFYALPIILFTSIGEQKQQGLEAGATVYLIKSEYSQNQLIKTLQELLYA